MWERYAFKWLDENSAVKRWASEEFFIPYFYDVDKSYHRYFPDILIEWKNGRTTLVEIKPFTQTKPPKYPGRKTKRYINEGLSYVKNVNKWKAAEEFCKDRGWDFVIWTEKELEAQGIKPKSTKALKPLPPFRKPKK